MKQKLSSKMIKEIIVIEYKKLGYYDVNEKEYEEQYKYLEYPEYWKRDSKHRLSSEYANLQSCDVFFKLSPGIEPTGDGGWYNKELYEKFLALPVSEQDKCILRTFVFDSDICVRCEVVSNPEDTEIIVISFIHD